MDFVLWYGACASRLHRRNDSRTEARPQQHQVGLPISALKYKIRHYLCDCLSGHPSALIEVAIQAGGHFKLLQERTKLNLGGTKQTTWTCEECIFSCLVEISVEMHSALPAKSNQSAYLLIELEIKRPE